MMFAAKENNLLKNASNDRIIVLKRKEGENALSSTGLVDNRIFTGDNKLHAILDVQYNLWYLKFEAGLVPPVFQQRFTTFNNLLDFVREYYSKRNIEIVEVIY